MINKGYLKKKKKKHDLTAQLYLKFPLITQHALYEKVKRQK